MSERDLAENGKTVASVRELKKKQGGKKERKKRSLRYKKATMMVSCVKTRCDRKRDTRSKKGSRKHQPRIETRSPR